MHVVLYEPEIPTNTGNIVRTCAATGTSLHLVGRLGFSLEDKYLKRAGLDYWDLANIMIHENLEELWRRYGDHIFYYTSKKAENFYTDVEYGPECFLVFGKETEGLPAGVLQKAEARLIKIPKLREARSLNLANSVSIVLYEALRQNGFNVGTPLS